MFCVKQRLVPERQLGHLRHFYGEKWLRWRPFQNCHQILQLQTMTIMFEISVWDDYRTQGRHFFAVLKELLNNVVGQFKVPPLAAETSDIFRVKEWLLCKALRGQSVETNRKLIWVLYVGLSTSYLLGLFIDWRLKFLSGHPRPEKLRHR